MNVGDSNTGVDVVGTVEEDAEIKKISIFYLHVITQTSDCGTCLANIGTRCKHMRSRNTKAVMLCKRISNSESNKLHLFTCFITEILTSHTHSDQNNH